jgi:hypothetical protein
MMASIFGRTDNIKFWLDRFPEWDYGRTSKLTGSTALHLAAQMGPHRHKLVKLLVERGASLAFCSHFGAPTLISTCLNEDVDLNTINYILTCRQSGWDVNQRRRATKFHLRCIFRLALILTKSGASRSAVMRYLAFHSGATALHHATKRGDVDAVNILLRHGADPTIKNDLGKTPMDYCDAFPELRGAFKRVIHQRRHTNKSVTLQRRNSTAIDMKFPMYLVPLDQLHQLYGGAEPRHERIEAHQNLKQRGELVRWEDLPIDAHIIFLSHEWVGWNHPDPHGIQLKTFLKVMKRLRSGKIRQVEMNVFQSMMYKTNHVVRANDWKEILSTAYVWIDWASMPQPSACPPSMSQEKKKKMEKDLGNAVKSIPAYV